MWFYLIGWPALMIDFNWNSCTKQIFFLTAIAILLSIHLFFFIFVFLFCFLIAKYWMIYKKLSALECWSYSPIQICKEKNGKWQSILNKKDEFYLRFQEKWEQWAISLANKIPSNDRDIARVDRFELKWMQEVEGKIDKTKVTCVQNETFILPGRELIKLEFTFFIVAHISGSPSSSSRAPSACLTFATGAVSWRNSLLASPNLLLSTHLYLDFNQ